MSDSDEIRINEISLPKSKLKDLIRMVWHNTANKDTDMGTAAKAKQLALHFPPSETPMTLSKKEPWTPEKEVEKQPKPKQLPLPFNRKTPITSKKRKRISFPRNENPPPLEKPQVISTLFSKRLDTSKPPFYTDADKWLKDNFVQGQSGIQFPHSYVYKGPDVSKTDAGRIFIFGKSVHGSPQSHDDAIKFKNEREEYMDRWNRAVREKIMKKWPNDFAGMSESQQIKLQK